MKRIQLIERLETVGYKRRELWSQSNENIRAIYQQARPLLERRAAEVQRIARLRERDRLARALWLEKEDQKRKKQLARIRAEHENMRLQEAWMRRCVKVPVPTITAPEVRALEFGLASLIAYATIRACEHGDQDAISTLRMIRGGVNHG